MHNEAVVVISGKVVRYNFAESLREQALIYILDGVVHVFLRGRNTPLAVALAGSIGHKNVLCCCWCKDREFGDVVIWKFGNENGEV